MLCVATLACRSDGFDNRSSASVATRVPDDAARPDAWWRMSHWDALPVFGDGAYHMQSSEDRQTGDKQKLALWDNGNRDFNNFVCRGRDTDAPDAQVPYVLDTPTCAEPYVRGMVLARFEGRGRLARFWMTAASIRAAAPDAEVFRVYVDDAPTPLVQVPLADMLGGSAHAMFAPPFGAASRRYVAWHYPIAFDTRLILSLDHLGDNDLYFHQTSVVLEPPSTRAADAEGAIGLLEGGAPSAPTRRETVALDPRGTHAIALRGPATIVATTVHARDREAFERVALTVAWDDGKPAIDLPLVDLFALWDAPAARPSLALAATSGGDGVTATLRLPMPFAERARLSLTNTSDQPVRLDLSLAVSDTLPNEPFGRLHVERHETTAGTKPTHPLAKAVGRGRLVGVCMSLWGHGMQEGLRRGHPFHFLEGDEMGMIDGRRALSGTGTEDYFNGAFYFEDGPRGTPFAQVWDITPSGPQARVSTCRWHVLTDAIDFARSLELTMEVGPGRPAVLDRYRSVAFLYR